MPTLSTECNPNTESGDFCLTRDTLREDRCDEDCQSETCSDVKDGYQDRLVLALDYGTSFTSFAYSFTDSCKAKDEDIVVFRDWGPNMGWLDSVPSVISYSRPSRAGEAQWGSDLSDKAVPMINTKLELDAQDTNSEELDLIIKALEGMGNLSYDFIESSKGFTAYNWKTAGEIVADFLGKVALRVLGDYGIGGMGQEYLQRIPVDFVITMPARWSYRAQNSLFQAVNQAFKFSETFPNLRNILKLSETEAAAIYAVRDISAHRSGIFRAGDFFVLCDAGRSRVDAVSYKIISTDPVELEQAELVLPTCGKFGFDSINDQFKQWLAKLLGPEHYAKLEPARLSRLVHTYGTESNRMREVIRVFESRKSHFREGAKDFRFDLPMPLEYLTVGDKVKEGEVTVTCEDMKGLFDPVIDDISELIQTQIEQIEENGSRVNNIILIGDFGESPYLQNELDFSFTRLRKIPLHQPRLWWNTVVRGAVIYGVKRRDSTTVCRMGFCPRSWGISIEGDSEYVARHNSDLAKYFEDRLAPRTTAPSHVAWLIKKGDLILSASRREGRHPFTWIFKADHSRKFRLPVFEPVNDDDVALRNPRIIEVTALECDFTNIPRHKFEAYHLQDSSETYFFAKCVCEIEFDGKTANCRILWADRIISTAVIEV